MPSPYELCGVFLSWKSAAGGTYVVNDVAIDFATANMMLES